MTREEALYEIEDYDEFSPNKNPSRIVNEIFDYFETEIYSFLPVFKCVDYSSKTCKDCNSYTHNKYPDQAYCDEGVSMDDDINMLEPDFGCNMFKVREPISKLTEYEIWSEGYVATGNSSDATFHGKESGYTFNDAIKTFADKNGHDWDFRDGKWSVWGCDIFDNETEARAAFG